MTKKRIESKVLTVSEIAEEAGVSRNLVWSYIRNHKIKPIVKEKRKYKIDSDIVLKIKQKQVKKQARNDASKNSGGVSKDVLEILHEQLKVKDQQIDDQAKTINCLLREVVENSETRKMLDDAQKKEEAITADELKKSDKKKHWWQKLF